MDLWFTSAQETFRDEVPRYPPIVTAEDLWCQLFRECGLARTLAGQPSHATRATKMVVNRYVRWMANEILDVSLAFEAISREVPEHPAAVKAWTQARPKGGQ